MEMMLALAASSVLYHMTSLERACMIVNGDKFQLSPVITQKEEIAHNNGQPYYFLSCARSKHNMFFKNNPHRRNGDFAVFVLDGQKIAANHTVKPVSFSSTLTGQLDEKWGNGDETEDRIFATKSSMKALRYIKEIHFFEPATRKLGPEVRAMLVAAKMKGIPLFRYADRDAAAQLDKRNTVPLTMEQKIKLTQRRPRLAPRGYKSYTLKTIWRLLKSPKVAREAFLKLASNQDEEWELESVWDNLVAGENPESTLQLLDASIESNTDPYAPKLINYMARKNIKTTKGLIQHIQERWR